jgi:anti-sigma-K factor RskA
LATLQARSSKLTQTIAHLESQNLVQASTIAQLKTTSPQVNAWSHSAVSVVWDKNRQEGILVLSQMPTAETGKIYQLWVIDPAAKAPVSAGTFEVRDDGTARILFRPSHPISQAAQFAVSLESGREKTQPEGPVILAGSSL